MSAKTVRCPDCNGVAGTGRVASMQHDETCPIGAGAAAAVEADRLWFLAHPMATDYHRPITTPERFELSISEPRTVMATHVQVFQWEAGVRSRRTYVKGPCGGCGHNRELSVIWVLACDTCEGAGICGSCAPPEERVA